MDDGTLPMLLFTLLAAFIAWIILWIILFFILKRRRNTTAYSGWRQPEPIDLEDEIIITPLYSAQTIVDLNRICPLSGKTVANCSCPDPECRKEKAKRWA
jgi:hypothetical protein